MHKAALPIYDIGAQFFVAKKRGISASLYILVSLTAEWIAPCLEKLIVVDPRTVMIVVHTALTDRRNLIVLLREILRSRRKRIGIRSF